MTTDDTVTELRDILMGAQRLRDRALRAGASIVALEFDRAARETQGAIAAIERPRKAVRWDASGAASLNEDATVSYGVQTRD